MSLKKLGPGLLISLATNGYGQPVRQTVSEPARAQLIYQDLANFWKAFDSSAKGTDYNAYERYYITPGSTGVKNFVGNNRIVNADTLPNFVTPTSRNTSGCGSRCCPSPPQKNRSGAPTMLQNTYTLLQSFLLYTL